MLQLVVTPAARADGGGESHRRRRPPGRAEQSIALEAARDEWTSYTVQFSNLPAGDYALRLRPLVAAEGGASIGPDRFEAYQVLTMPVDVNRAAYVRHTGESTAARRLPRALLPLKTDVRPEGGLIPIASLRDPSQPTKPSVHAMGATAVDVWVNVHVPADAPPGDYAAACDVIPVNATGNAPGTKPSAPAAVVSVPVKLTVYDFALPKERHLQMLSQLDWEGLVRHYPQNFETVTPRLITRTDDRYAATVKTLDDLMRLAQHHRLGLVVPRLQPTVKWPALIGDAEPTVDWNDFDSLVEPWFRGTAFPDRTGLTYWPLPEPDFLRNYDPRSRLQYWSLAETHFDQGEWLPKTAVALSKVTPGRARAEDAIALSSDAAQLLKAHKRLRVAVPLEDDQIQLASRTSPHMIDVESTDRLLTAGPGLVFSPPLQEWPKGIAEPEHWLRTDLPGLVPYVGAGGDENDVRLWAWLAFLRQAKFVVWGSPLPSLKDPSAAADPSELIWFYPGEWFGTDEPVPTVQLKWLRRAQQDFEYLWLARERGENVNAFQMARLVTKPVEIRPGQAPDPTYALMTGTSDRQAWADGRRLLAKSILLHPEGKPVDPDRQNELYLQTLQWARPQERPLMMGRTTGWGWEERPGGGAGGGAWVSMTLGLDVYNASDVTPDGELRWTALPTGWEVSPAPVKVPALSTYQVRRVDLAGRFDLSKITPGARQPLEMEMTIDGLVDGRQAKLVSPVKLTVPVAACEHREGRSALDGRLDDWSADDLIHDGKLVRMLDRPDVQRQHPRPATTATKIYTGWAEPSFYVGFAVEGVARPDSGGRNDVDYQARRAWGEDLCEVLVQPVFANNTLGPVLHLVCKPNGTSWVERKLNPWLNANPWEPFESTGVRYAAHVDSGKWTGELAVPWKVLSDPQQGRPVALKFNFAQHNHTTGESASWAGPVDFGRDDAFTGLLYLKGTPAPGPNDAVLNN